MATSEQSPVSDVAANVDDSVGIKEADETNKTVDENSVSQTAIAKEILNELSKALGTGQTFNLYFRDNPLAYKSKCTSGLCGMRRQAAVTLGRTEICDKEDRFTLFAYQTPETTEVLIVDAATGRVLVHGLSLGHYKVGVSCGPVALGTIEEQGKCLTMHCGCLTNFLVKNAQDEELYNIRVPEKDGVEGLFQDPIMLKIISMKNEGLMMGQMERMCANVEGEKKCFMKLTLPPALDIKTRALLIFAAHSVFCNYFANSGGGGTWYGYKGIRKRSWLGVVLWSLLALTLVIIIASVIFVHAKTVQAEEAIT